MADARRSYDAWHASVSGTAALDTPWHRMVQDAVDRQRDLAGKRVLEIACGRGEFATWCAALPSPPALIVAADFSGVAVRLARRAFLNGGDPCTPPRHASADAAPGAPPRHPSADAAPGAPPRHPSADAAPGAPPSSSLAGAPAPRSAPRGRAVFFQGDAQAIGLSSGSFDTAICCETLEHLHDPIAALHELARVLRPGGHLFLTTPNYLGPMGAYRGYLRLTGRRYSEEGQPVNRFLLAPRLRRWVRRAGLEIIGRETTGHYLPWPGRAPILVQERSRWLSPFGLHSLTVAVRP